MSDILRKFKIGQIVEYKGYDHLFLIICSYIHETEMYSKNPTIYYSCITMSMVNDLYQLNSLELTNWFAECKCNLYCNNIKKNKNALRKLCKKLKLRSPKILNTYNVHKISYA